MLYDFSSKSAWMDFEAGMVFIRIPWLNGMDVSTTWKDTGLRSEAHMRPGSGCLAFPGSPIGVMQFGGQTVWLCGTRETAHLLARVYPESVQVRYSALGQATICAIPPRNNRLQNPHKLKPVPPA